MAAEMVVTIKIKAPEDQFVSLLGSLEDHMEYFVDGDVLAADIVMSSVINNETGESYPVGFFDED